MYGIINRAIQDLVIENFGEQKWEEIKINSGIDVQYFFSNMPYDDDITFKLAISISHVMKIPLRDVLITFGEYWVLKTGKEKYGALMQAGGSNLKDFLVNLPQFHNRIMLMFPKLTPPEFQVSDITDNSLHLHYFSKREGLSDFVLGLLQGLGKLYDTSCSIELLDSRAMGSSHETFKVSW